MSSYATVLRRSLPWCAGGALLGGAGAVGWFTWAGGAPGLVAAGVLAAVAAMAAFVGASLGFVTFTFWRAVQLAGWGRIARRAGSYAVVAAAAVPLLRWLGYLGTGSLGAEIIGAAILCGISGAYMAAVDAVLPVKSKLA